MVHTTTLQSVVNMVSKAFSAERTKILGKRQNFYHKGRRAENNLLVMNELIER